MFFTTNKTFCFNSENYSNYIANLPLDFLKIFSVLRSLSHSPTRFRLRGAFTKTHENGISWVLLSDKLDFIEISIKQKGDESMSISEQVRKSQNIKEMTRRAIQQIEALGGNADDLKAEFFVEYGEEV